MLWLDKSASQAYAGYEVIFMHYESIDALLQDLPRLAQAHQESLAGQNATILFETTQGRKTYCILQDGVLTLADSIDTAPDCTISASEDDLLDLVRGKLNPMAAFMFGKVKVTGNMGLLMGLMAMLK